MLSADFTNPEPEQAGHSLYTLRRRLGRIRWRVISISPNGLALRSGSVGWWVGAALWAALAVWVVVFFRDPERRWAIGERMIVAPADGKVVSVIETDEPAFHGGRALRISIFMNVFDCHVNRYPVSGTVAYRHYNPGKFGHAAAE
jgi:phosphatidylserine decarboxylase